MATIDIPGKICSHCGGTRWNLSPSKNNYVCVIRQKEYSRRYYLKNTEAVKKRIRYNESVYLKDPVMKVKLYELHLNWKKRNPEKVKQYKNKTNERIRTSLADEYVKRQLIQYTNLKFEDVPQNLVILKRKQLLLKRKIKQNVKN